MACSRVRLMSEGLAFSLETGGVVAAVETTEATLILLDRLKKVIFSDLWVGGCA